MSQSKDETIAAIATKSLKEISYHRRHSADWVIRLGDGTDESHERMQKAIDELWGYTPEMFDMDELERAMVDKEIGADLAILKPKWDVMINRVLTEATLQRPEDTWEVRGSREGVHSEHLGFLLAEMQFLPRAYPEARW